MNHHRLLNTPRIGLSSGGGGGTPLAPDETLPELNIAVMLTTKKIKTA